MNFIRSGHTYSHRGLLYPARFDGPYLPVKTPMPTGGDTSAKQQVFRSIPPNDRRTKDWTTIAWPTNIQSGTPDGKFGPATQIKGWGDCWFLAPLAAVANDKVGHKILAESIKKGTVEGISGYFVTFAGLPNNTVFILDAELQELLKTQGGDADTRLMELAADRFFKKSGNFKSLLIAAFMGKGQDRDQAEKCFQEYCQLKDIQDPMTFNPMRDGAPNAMAFFMFTGIYPDLIIGDRGMTIQTNDVMMFLKQYVTDDRDGASVVISGIENPLGNTYKGHRLVLQWDVIRTEITSNGTVDPQQHAFLSALVKWLKTRSWCAMMVLRTEAGKMKLEHIHPVEFVKTLAQNQYYMDQDHFDVLRSGVQAVLAGGSGYIGFAAQHAGTIEEINAATNMFTYSESNFPTLVHTGELPGLIQAIMSGNAFLTAVEPTTGQDEAESSHAGEKRGRHLRQIHHQAVRDGRIDPAESGPLANQMEMDDGAFRHVYDRDNNGVIEGGELKAVQLRVDRWVDHLKLTPIW